MLSIGTIVDTIKLMRSIISDAAMVGFDYKQGDWAERLYASQAVTKAALDEVAKESSKPVEVAIIPKERGFIFNIVDDNSSDGPAFRKHFQSIIDDAERWRALAKYREENGLDKGSGYIAYIDGLVRKYKENDHS